MTSVFRVLLLAPVLLAAVEGTARAQAPCVAGLCDILVQRLMITGEDCAMQTFDPSQTVEYSQLVTGAQDFDTFPISLYYPIYAWQDRFDGVFDSLDPGFTAVPSPCNVQPDLAPLPPMTGLYFDYLTETPTAGGPARNLLYWDGQDDDMNGLDENDVEWSPVPIDEIFGVVKGTTVLGVADGGTDEIEGSEIIATGASGNIHNHVRFSLRRDSVGQATFGVYLLKLDLTVPGFAEGAPIHLIFSTIGIAAGAENVARTQVENEMVFTLCDDGVDNDRDGFIDFAGGDPGCDSPADDSEKSTTYECDDGIDNDGDGFIDYREDDFGSAGLYLDRDPECDGQGPEGFELPEPSGTLMLAAGAGFLAALDRRRKRLRARGA